MGIESTAGAPLRPRFTVALVDESERSRLATALAAPGRAVDRGLLARQAAAIAERRREECDLAGAARAVAAATSAYMNAMQSAGRLRRRVADGDGSATGDLANAVRVADELAHRLSGARQVQDRLRQDLADDITRTDRLAALEVLSATTQGMLVLDEAVMTRPTASDVLATDDLEQRGGGGGRTIVLTSQAAILRWAAGLGPERVKVVDPADLWTVAGSLIGTGA